MGRNGKKPLGSRNIDGLLRANFLYQASNLYSSIVSDESSQNTNENAISSFLSHNMKQICQKVVLRTSRSIRNSMCKKCDSILIPGKTADHKQKGNRTTIRCRICNSIKHVTHKNSKRSNSKSKNKKPISDNDKSQNKNNNNEIQAETEVATNDDTKQNIDNNADKNNESKSSITENKVKKEGFSLPKELRDYAKDKHNITLISSQVEI